MATTTEFELRTATHDGLPELMRLELAGFDAGIREPAEVFARRITAFPNGSLLAVRAGVVMGCFFSQLRAPGGRFESSQFACCPDQNAHVDAACRTELYISSMTVAPPFRNAGVGGRLFRQATARVASDVPSVQSMVLLVNVHWVRAQAIYRDNGFTECGRLADFFRPLGLAPQTAIMMRRLLRSPHSSSTGR